MWKKMHIGVDYILLNKLILYNKNLRKCESVFFVVVVDSAGLYKFIYSSRCSRKKKHKKIYTLIIAHFFIQVSPGFPSTRDVDNN